MAKSEELKTILNRKISAGLVSAFFLKWFNGLSQYDRLCREERTGEPAVWIKLMSGKTPPQELRNSVKAELEAEAH